MGEKNEAILSYLEDNARFADLMNGAVFGGIQAVEMCIRDRPAAPAAKPHGEAAAKAEGSGAVTKAQAPVGKTEA